MSAPFAVFEDQKKKVSYWFSILERRWESCDPFEVQSFLRDLEKKIPEGTFLVVLLSYELGYTFQEKAISHPPGRVPLCTLLWFGKQEKLSSKASSQRFMGNRQKDSNQSPLAIYDLQLLDSPSVYEQRVEEIREKIAAGETYQVNYTSELSFRYQGCFRDLYLALRKWQPVPFNALVHCEDRTILSFSPELFVKRAGENLICKPMKGTALRGKNPEENEICARKLAQDIKNRAENLMIVDMVRNDMGRVASLGSVVVDRLYEVESYPTLLQMTSTVRCSLDEGKGFYEILRALFPCASITGAPKLRTMEIIASLETRPRDLYTGALGLLHSGGDFTLSVPIRTLELQHDSKNRRGRGVMGVGSGITYDSKVRDEYQETCLKADFLTKIHKSFHLLETGRLPKGAKLPLYWPLHKNRLLRSARFFSFSCSSALLESEMESFLRDCDLSEDSSFRMCLSFDGEILCEQKPFSLLPKGPLCWAPFPVDSQDLFLRHKTSHRGLYERALAEAESQRASDALFYNEKGEITESTRATLFLFLQGRWVTPSKESGLLPGILRESLLREGQVEEKKVFQEDLQKADKICLGNAMRGLYEVCPPLGEMPFFKKVIEEESVRCRSV